MSDIHRFSTKQSPYYGFKVRSLESSPARHAHAHVQPLFITGHRSIPEVYGWGRSQFFEYLSMQLLGPDLGTWFILMEKPLTSRNLNAIVWQMVRYKVPGSRSLLRSSTGLARYP